MDMEKKLNKNKLILMNLNSGKIPNSDISNEFIPLNTSPQLIFNNFENLNCQYKFDLLKSKRSRDELLIKRNMKLINNSNKLNKDNLTNNIKIKNSSYHLSNLTLSSFVDSDKDETLSSTTFIINKKSNINNPITNDKIIKGLLEIANESNKNDTKINEIKSILKKRNPEPSDWNRLKSLTNLTLTNFNTIKNCLIYKNYQKDNIQLIFLCHNHTNEYGLFFKIDPFQMKYSLSNRKLNFDVNDKKK